jgi:carboxyl-terminal processing protease
VQTIQSYDGQSMEVTILRDGAKQILEVTPGSFDSTVICTLNGDVGEVVLSSFSEDSGKDFADALKRLKEAGATKLILDLRNNGGGYLSAAQAIASSLLPENSLIFLEDTKSGTNELYTSDDYEQVEFDEIVILQNQNSASASEVLIGALKDNLGDKVKTVGTTTYGKGTEQVSIPFSDGTSLKVTIAEWRTPNGTSINNTGFEPDYAVQASAIRSVSYMAMEEEDVILPDTVHVNAKALQMYLSYLGYDADRQDNYFSQASSQALAQFQEDQGLEATGNADAVTWQHLLDAVSVKLNENEKDEDVQRQQALDLLAG